MINPELELDQDFVLTRVAVPKKKPGRREVPLIPPLPIRDPNPFPVTQPPIRKPDPVPVTQ